jgi:hypothetical protein
LAVVTFFLVILDPDITGEFVVCESESSILFLAVDRLLPTVLPDLSDSSLEVSVVSFLLVLVLDLREESSLSASVFVLGFYMYLDWKILNIIFKITTKILQIAY